MVTQPRLVLASASPRRTALLTQIGIPHEVVPASIEEAAPYVMTPTEYVTYLSEEKAKTVFDGTLVLAADTVVAIDEHILEKPADEEDARRMLALLSGRTHFVITGVTLMDQGRTETFAVTTKVRFGELPAAWVDQYVKTSEPYDKAGGYGIQSLGGLFVEAIDGDYYNVVGLPIHPVARHLESFGIHPVFA